LKNHIDNNVDMPKGGPLLGAVVNVTSDLAIAVEAVAKGKTLREKAEALQFLTESQKTAHAAASIVVAMARKAGKPIVVVGGKFFEKMLIYYNFSSRKSIAISNALDHELQQEN